MPDSALSLSASLAGASMVGAPGTVPSPLSGVVAKLVSMLAPKASFVVAGIPVTATSLQWIAAICSGIVLATVFASRRHLAVEPPLWWALFAGLVSARLVYLMQHWGAYAPSGADGGWHAIVQIVDVRDGGVSMSAGVLGGLVVLLAVAAWRRALRGPLAVIVLAGLLVWCGAGAALHVGAAGRAMLPDWTFASVDAAAAPVSLQGRPEQATVINLWATWCGPCRREMPVFARAQAAYPSIHIVFADQGETAAQVQQYLGASHLKLDNVVLDREARLGSRYRSSVVPTTLFFHADGRFADVHFGEMSDAALRAALDKLK